ncbi:unnamed protein product, partial [Phaeothamnion confervicola]
GKRSTRDWDLVDFDKLEEEWQEGDDEAELKTESQLMFDRLERRKKQYVQASAQPLDPQALAKMGPKAMQRFLASQKDAAGPTMMFVKLRATDAAMSPTAEKEDAERVATMYREMALVGGLEVTPYYVQERTLLVSMQKGWEGQEALDFLLSRLEVDKVTWNNQDFYPDRDSDGEL